MVTSHSLGRFQFRQIFIYFNDRTQSNYNIQKSYTLLSSSVIMKTLRKTLEEDFGAGDKVLKIVSASQIGSVISR